MRPLTFIMAICLASTAQAGMFDLPSFNDIKQKIPFLKEDKKGRAAQADGDDDGDSYDFKNDAKEKLQKIA